MIDSDSINVVEKLRRYAIEHVMNVKSMEKYWGVWRNKIIRLVGDPPDPTRVLDLGSHLADVFSSTKVGGRDQGALSGGGVGWECLVCWYCNICMLGSRVVIIKYKKDLIPKPLQEAITVSHGNVNATSEADLLAIVFPDRIEYVETEPNPKKEIFLDDLNQLTKEHFKEYGLGIIQCKTNWNDSSQIAMLWDMIYRMKNFQGTNIRVGTSKYSITNIKNFTYSFATVPSNPWEKFKPDQIQVKRLSVLSGSNYWGHETKYGIAHSLSEIFSNFDSGHNNQIVANMRKPLKDIRNRYNYFKLYK